MAKLSTMVTKTLSATSADDLDSAITAFINSKQEEQFLEIRFSAAPGFFAALILYTR